MRTAKVVTVALLAVVALGQQPSAQSLTISLFERYLESLRLESGIPGLSVALVQNGRIAWEKGLGFQDVEGLVRASEHTPYPITDLSQTLASTLLLQHCLDSGRLEVTDRVRRWIPAYPEDSTTVGALLRHVAPSGGFEYDPSRFSSLTNVIEQCASEKYPRLLTEEILERVSMTDTVPSHEIPDQSLFSTSALDRYASILRNLAVPYRIDSSRRPVKSDYRARSLNASTGIVSTAHDLARFDAALAEGDLATQDSLREAWQTSGSMPTGLGWFVQQVDGPNGRERVVWHFGLAKDAYSSLVLKVPGRGLTLILLANSDGLAEPYGLSNGDVTKSLFARLFLRLFLV